MAKNEYSKSITLTTSSETRGIMNVANQLADMYKVSVDINTREFTTGVIFKKHRTEYVIRFSGDKSNVDTAIQRFEDSCMEYNERLRGDDSDKYYGPLSGFGFM